VAAGTTVLHAPGTLEAVQAICAGVDGTAAPVVRVPVVVAGVSALVLAWCGAIFLVYRPAERP
jgi:hypothetical protein